MPMLMPKPKKKQPSGSKGKVIGLAAAIVVVVAVVAGWFLFFRSTPEKTAKLFIEATALGDTEGMKTLLSSKSTQPRAGGYAMLKGNPSAAGGKEPAYAIGKATISGDTATVPITFQTPKEMLGFGRSMPEFIIHLGLVKEGMKWKVDEAETMKAREEIFWRMMQSPPGGTGTQTRPGQ